MKKLRYFLFGSIFTVIFTSVVSAYADSPTTITAIIGQIKLMINGEPVAHETLLYNDTTYIPLQVISDKLGKEIAYDDSKGMAYVDEYGAVRQQIIDIINSSMSVEYKALNLVKLYITGDDDLYGILTQENIDDYYLNDSYRLNYVNDLGDNKHVVKLYNVPEGEDTEVSSTYEYHVDITTGEIETLFSIGPFLTPARSYYLPINLSEKKPNYLETIPVLPKEAVGAQKKDKEIAEPVEFEYDNNLYNVQILYEVHLTGMDQVPVANVYLNLTNEHGSNYYYIGEYISSTFSVEHNWVHDIKKEVLLSCFMWYGGGGSLIDVALDNGKLYVYEIYVGDIPLDQADPIELAVIKLP